MIFLWRKFIEILLDFFALGYINDKDKKIFNVNFAKNTLSKSPYYYDSNVSGLIISQ